MGREFEMKFRATPAKMVAIMEDHGGFREISMETTYFDTPSRTLSPLHWTLRRRMENGVSRCTLKTPCDDGGRMEWETEWEDIHTAIDELIKLGAPESLKELVSEGLEPVCSARFVRQAATIATEDGSVELALDRGFLRGGFRMELLAEVEVELKEGSDSSAVAFANALAARYLLIPERRSKYRRALALAGQI